MSGPRTWLRSLRYGFRGLWTWARFAWEWRDFDWECAYGAYFLALARLRDHIASHQMHVGWEGDVAQIDKALGLWTAHIEAETYEDENATWIALHDHMKDNARRWWC